MKIRIQGNSIRYRLKQPEVESFQHSGQVTETIQLGMKPEEKLRFILQKSDVKTIALHYSSDTAVVLVPESIAVQWTNTDQVGFDAVIEIGGEGSLKVLVEKDFACLDGSEEENIGSYPNPAKAC